MRWWFEDDYERDDSIKNLWINKQDEKMCCENLHWWNHDK